MRGYPQFSFSISIKLVKIYISRIIINRGKNTFELVGTALKDVRAHCYCASLQRTQIHVPRHASSARFKY